MTVNFKISFALTLSLSIFGGISFPGSAHSQTNRNYMTTITGSVLSQYTAFPKRRLVIVTARGTIKLRLFEKIAPNHVSNIINLANSGFYNSTYFHRVIPGFMIQGGDPNTKDSDFSNDGQGNSPNRVNAEFSKVHHARGILSMARASDPNSASCQFFICVADAATLDGKYTVFGQVTDGMEVVDDIASLPDVTNRPQSQISATGNDPGRAAEILRMYVEIDRTNNKADKVLTAAEQRAQKEQKKNKRPQHVIEDPVCQMQPNPGTDFANFTSMYSNSNPTFGRCDNVKGFFKVELANNDLSQVFIFEQYTQKKVGEVDYIHYPKDNVDVSKSKQGRYDFYTAVSINDGCANREYGVSGETLRNATAPNGSSILDIIFGMANRVTTTFKDEHGTPHKATEFYWTRIYDDLPDCNGLLGTHIYTFEGNETENEIAVIVTAPRY